jgi:membrane protein implicated in regulation of membrane protease activity
LWLAITVPLAAVLCLLLPWTPAVFGAGVGFLVNALHLAAWIFSALALPLVLITLVAFVYSVWGKPYLRAWRIRRIRNARQLREAVERGRIEE